jgi:hypothetical protein
LGCRCIETLKNVTHNSIALQTIAHGVGSYNKKMADLLKT